MKKGRKAKIRCIWIAAIFLLTSIVLADTYTSAKEEVNEKVICSIQPTIEWENTYGEAEFDEFRDVQGTSDGGYIACGTTQESDSLYPWVLKVDSDGNEEWRRIITGFDYYGTYYDMTSVWCDRILQTTDNGYIACLIILDVNYNEVEHGLGGLVKLDSNGAEEWLQIYGDEFEWTIMPQGMMEVDDGIMCVGAHTPTSGDLPLPDRAQCLFKIDSAGELIWHQEYNYGEQSDWARSLCSTDDGGFLIVGLVRISANEWNPWMMKTDSQGVEEWTKIYSYRKTSLWNVFQTSDGGYIAAGTTSSLGAGSEDGWALKTDSNGNEQWNRTFGGRKTDFCHGLGITDDGGFIFGVLKNIMELGGTRDDILLIKTDGMGNTEWSESYGGSEPDGVWSLDTTSDGGFIVAGYSGPYFGESCDALLVKYAAFDNQRPDKPAKPSGPSSGRPEREYTFTTSASDADGDQVYFMWDWGDGNFSEWLGPYNSGDTCEASYTWTGEDNYIIRVMAKDEHGGESDWSEPLSFSTPKNEFILLFIGFLEHHPYLFPILRYILGL